MERERDRDFGILEEKDRSQAQNCPAFLDDPLQIEVNGEPSLRDAVKVVRLEWKMVRA